MIYDLGFRIARGAVEIFAGAIPRLELGIIKPSLAGREPRRILIATSALLLFTVLLAPQIQTASAQSLGIGIFPPVLQIDTTPPSSVKANIVVQNQTDQSATYTIFLQPFTASGNYNGQPQFDSALLSEYKTFFGKIQITDGNHRLQTLTLSPKQKKALVMHIGIPKGEKPQDYYFSVLFVSKPTGSGDNSAVSTQGGIGTNVLVSIGPKPPATGAITQFSSPGFITGGPVKMRLQVANTSPSYFAPKGSVVVRNMFGQAVGQVPVLGVNILSHSKRYVPSKGNQDQENPQIVWDKKFLLGFYSATATLSLSDQGPVVTEKTTFFAFPIEGILAIIICLLILVAIFKRVKAKKKEEY